MQEEMNDKFTSAILYFENKNVSVNQFDQTIIKPAFTFFFDAPFLEKKEIVSSYVIDKIIGKVEFATLLNKMTQ